LIQNTIKVHEVLIFLSSRCVDICQLVVNFEDKLQVHVTIWLPGLPVKLVVRL